MSRRQEFDVAALDYRFTPAGAELEGKSERYVAASRPSGHLLEAHLGGELVGRLRWHAQTGEVHLVGVTEAHRGKGIASALWGAGHVMAARHGVPPPRHSDVKFPDGVHWANKQTVQSGPGKKQPPRQRLSRKPGPGQQELF